MLVAESAAVWARWITRNQQSAGVWLRLAKARASFKTLTYQEALEVALCYGWIDGQKKSLDRESWLQKFTPRGPRSIWSEINKRKALALIARGRMRKAGLAAVEAAKASGRWDKAYASYGTARVPNDLEAELKARPLARRFFDSLDSRNRYAILFRLHGAAKPETRERRLKNFVSMLERQEKIYP